jgi:hypothetical protein
MQLPDELARFQPPAEVQDLGPPDQVFCDSARMVAIYRYGTLITGLVLLFLGFPLVLGKSPGAIVGGCVVAVLAALIIRWGWRRSRPWCYLIYPDGMAYFTGKSWEMLGWEDVVEFHSVGQSHGPYLMMLDGSQVHLHRAAWFHAELHERIAFCLMEARSQPGGDPETEGAVRATVHVLETRAQLEDGSHQAEDVLRSALKAAPTSGRMRIIRKTKKKREELPLETMMIGGLILIGSAYFYYYLNHLEKTVHDPSSNWLIMLANMLGGKVMVAALIALVALAVMASAFKIAKFTGENDQGEKPRRTGGW